MAGASPRAPHEGGGRGAAQDTREPDAVSDGGDTAPGDDKISRVMLGGRMYDAATLNEVVTGKRQRLPYWWGGPGGERGRLMLATIEFFENRGKAVLKQHDHEHIA